MLTQVSPGATECTTFSEDSGEPDTLVCTDIKARTQALIPEQRTEGLPEA
jgi:hypothetical protein